MKKKISILVAVLFMAAGSVAFAQGFTGNGSAAQAGGFIEDGSSKVVTPIKAAKKMRDDTIVTIRGNIIRRIGDDKYMVRDASGEMVVEIDDEDWGGVTASSADLLELTGEVDKDFTKVKIDVYSVVKVPQ